MFDIGFAELVLIGIVALLVIGPERLPAAVRTASLWLNRLRRGFNEIKQEVQQELHNDSVMQELRETGERLKDDTNSIGQDLQSAATSLTDPVSTDTASTAEPEKPPTDKNAE
jgi:sec-independent protein translocase protein TatB